MYNAQPQYVQFSMLSGTGKREGKHETADKQTRGRRSVWTNREGSFPSKNAKCANWRCLRVHGGHTFSTTIHNLLTRLSGLRLQPGRAKEHTNEPVCCLARRPARGIFVGMGLGFGEKGGRGGRKSAPVARIKGVVSLSVKGAGLIT